MDFGRPSSGKGRKRKGTRPFLHLRKGFLRKGHVRFHPAPQPHFRERDTSVFAKRKRDTSVLRKRDTSVFILPPTALDAPLGISHAAKAVSDKRLLGLIDNFSSATVLAVGDFILDEFVYGEISRISREAPVLILSYRETRPAAGGGANAVAGIDALDARAIAVGWLGADEAGDRLLSCWSESVDRAGVFREPGLQTTRKTRILAGSFHSFRQQVVRIDHEHPLRLTTSQEDRLKAALQNRVAEAGALMLSDYGLGTVTARVRDFAIELGRRHGKPVIVDSRFDPAGFPGATSVTPNISEVETALGRKIGHSAAELEEVGARLRRVWKVESLLITRGKLGMSLFEESAVTHIPAHGVLEAVDVTGAGDTVIATYATALAAGANFREAARLANVAGGIVVGKKGTATVSRRELRNAVEADPEGPA